MAFRFWTLRLKKYIPSLRQSVCHYDLSGRPSIYPSLRRSICPSLSVRLFVSPSSLSICLFASVSVHPSLCLSVFLSVCLSVFLPVCPSVRLTVFQSSLSPAKLRAGHIYIVRKISHDVDCNCLFVYYLSLPGIWGQTGLKFFRWTSFQTLLV